MIGNRRAVRAAVMRVYADAPTDAAPACSRRRATNSPGRDAVAAHPSRRGEGAVPQSCGARERRRVRWRRVVRDPSVVLASCSTFILYSTHISAAFSDDDAGDRARDLDAREFIDDVRPSSVVVSGIGFDDGRWIARTVTRGNLSTRFFGRFELCLDRVRVLLVCDLCPLARDSCQRWNCDACAGWGGGVCTWPVEAAGAVDAKSAPTSSLENARARFPQLPQAVIVFVVFRFNRSDAPVRAAPNSV